MRDPNANFPANLDELVTAGLLRSIETDPWGQPWEYCAPNRQNDKDGAVWSRGPDGSGGVGKGMDCTKNPPAPVAGTDTADHGLYYIIDVKP